MPFAKLLIRYVLCLTTFRKLNLFAFFPRAMKLLGVSEFIGLCLCCESLLEGEVGMVM